jgi:hypothetical protein
MSIPDLPKVNIYTDGACNPNPGPGGWAAVLLFPDQEPKELVGSEPSMIRVRYGSERIRSGRLEQNLAVA